MPALVLQDLLAAAVDTVRQSLPRCQPLLVNAGVVAAGLAVVIGLFSDPELASAWYTVPVGLLTLLVSAGVAGFLLTEEQQFLSLGGIVNEPRTWRYFGRLIIVMLILLPIGVVLALLLNSLLGAGAGFVLAAFAVIGVVLYVYARILAFPYNGFLSNAPNLEATWKSTHGNVIPILGVVTLFQLGLVMVMTFASFLVEGVVEGLRSATGLSGGLIAVLVVQGCLQILAAFALDCALVTVTKRLRQPTLTV